MSELGRRTLTALVYGAVVLVAVFAPWPLFPLLALAAGLLGLAELARLLRGSGTTTSALLVGALAYLGAGLVALVGLWSAGAAGTHHGVPDAQRPWLLFALLPTWAADVAAYGVGSRFGTRKLAPRISPGKTWEGTLAGFLAAALVAYGVAAYAGMPRLPAFLGAVAIGPAALAGDLFESYLKRRAAVKDSGSILPGHGGVLDRVDSLLAAAVVAFVVLTIARVG